MGGDYRAKRQILRIVCSNFSLDGVTLCYTINKPFDALVKASEWKESGEGGIRTRGTGLPHTGFRNRLLQPLGHLSKRFAGRLSDANRTRLGP